MQTNMYMKIICSNFCGRDEHYFIRLPKPKLLIFDDESSEEETDVQTPVSTTPAAIRTNVRISESAPALLNLRTQGTDHENVMDE